MRTFAHIVTVAAAASVVALIAPGSASASAADEVSYAFSVNGTTVTNTISSKSGAALTCTTSLAPAPGGVLPPVEEVVGAGQSLYTTGQAQVGTTVQRVSNVPSGSYVVLASCGREAPDPAMWVSEYAGVEKYLAQYPYPAYTVQEASRVISISDSKPSTGSADPSVLGNGSAARGNG